MLKSFERELKVASKEKPGIIYQSALVCKTTMIIPKRDHDILFEEDYVKLEVGQEIDLSYLKWIFRNRLGLGTQKIDLVKWFQEVWDVGFLKNTFEIKNTNNLKKLKKNNPIATLILDALISKDGFDYEKNRSSWYSSNNSNCLININTIGELKYYNLDKQYMSALNFQNVITYPNYRYNIDYKIRLLKDLGLYDCIIDKIRYVDCESISLEKADEILRCSYEVRSVNILVSIKRDKNLDIEDSEIVIKYGVEYKDELISQTILTSEKEFNGLCNEILLKKKEFHNFSNILKMSNIKDIRAEKALWYTDSGKIVTVNLTEEELNFLNEKIFPQFNGMHKGRRISWERLYSILKDFENFYSEFNNVDDYVSSAPDTSKFIACKAGWVKLDIDFTAGESQYHRGTYFKYGLKVGGNYKYGNPFNVLKYMLLLVANRYGLPNYKDGKDLCIRTTSGTNWSAIGIG